MASVAAAAAAPRYPALRAAAFVSDLDVLRQHHEFLPPDADGGGGGLDHDPHALPRARATTAGAGGAAAATDPRAAAATADSEDTWETRLARRYGDRLHKEYALGDLSQYRSGHVGLRWRTEAEVVAGKGQFVCGALGCDGVAGLHSYELPFRYTERGEAKNALVKVRLCGRCAPKLFFKQLQQAQALVALEASARESSRDDVSRKGQVGRARDGQQHGDVTGGADAVARRADSVSSTGRDVHGVGRDDTEGGGRRRHKHSRHHSRSTGHKRKRKHDGGAGSADGSPARAEGTGAGDADGTRDTDEAACGDGDGGGRGAGPRSGAGGGRGAGHDVEIESEAGRGRNQDGREPKQARTH
jgi:hypothetical protein